jgi:uncharacterized protein YbjT (DUF2867 family)
MRIAVIGATGLLGKPVTQELINAGFTVTILARHPEQARNLFPMARIVPADLRDTDSLRAGLRGQEAVYLSLSVLQTERPGDFHTETDGLDHLLTAAREAGVQRIGYLSSIVMRYQGMNGFRWWVFDVKQEAVRKLKASGIPSLIFYPTTFMETLPGQVQGGRLLLGGKSDVKLWFIAARDYGRQVARAFQRSGPKSGEYVIQGPEPLTYAEAAELFAKNYSPKRLTVTTLPLGVMRFFGRFNRRADYGAHILEALNRYPEQFEADRTWVELGRPTTTLAEFARLVVR